ncbi:acid protease [Ramaria rubella]|nr:acid protease [Ramaria rubella]
MLSMNAIQNFKLDAVRSNPQATLRNDIVKVVVPDRFLNKVQCGKNQIFNDVINATFGVGYGTGSVSGNAFRDNVTIGEARAYAQIIGAANSTSGFNLVKPIDGILGLGPSGSNAGDVTGLNATPTFVETLVVENNIDHAVFGIFISPLGANGTPEGTGEITFGGIDESRIQGNITWVPQNPPLQFHWEFNVSAFSFGNITLTDLTSTRTDTGTLSIGIPTDQFFGIIDAYNGKIAFDNSSLSSFLSFPSNMTDSLPSMSFNLGGATFIIPPSQYIVPRNLYPALNVTDDPALTHTWIASAGPGAFELGQKWLESVYTAYDSIGK